jgi:hypothetical protein
VPSKSFFQFLTNVFTLGIGKSSAANTPRLIGLAVYGSVAGLLCLSWLRVQDPAVLLSGLILLVLLGVLGLVSTMDRGSVRTALTAVVAVGLLGVAAFGIVRLATTVGPVDEAQPGRMSRTEANLQGTLRYQNGTPATGVQILVHGRGTPAQTDSKGRFEFPAHLLTSSDDSISFSAHLADTVVAFTRRFREFPVDLVLSFSPRPIVSRDPDPAPVPNLTVPHSFATTSASGQQQNTSSALSTDLRRTLSTSRTSLGHRRFAAALDASTAAMRSVPAAAAADADVAAVLEQLNQVRSSAADSLTVLRHRHERLAADLAKALNTAQVHHGNQLFCEAVAVIKPAIESMQALRSYNPEVTTDTAVMHSAERQMEASYQQAVVEHRRGSECRAL